MPNPLAARARTSTRSTRQAVNKQSQSRRKGPSAKAWEQLRPFITVYYVKEGRSQDEILDLLSKKHGHTAELNMLKTRLKQWNLRKNYTKEEKEAAAKELKRCTDLGLIPPVEMKIDGRHPSWDRVHRQCRNNPELTSPWLQKNSQWRAIVSRLCLKASPTDHSLEVILREVRTYWGTIIVKQERMPGTKIYEPSALTIGFLVGLRLIYKGDFRQGWHDINNACGSVINVFRSQQPDLLSEIMSLFAAKSWNLHRQIFSMVAKYLLAASRDLVGSGHPLSHILSALVALVAEENLDACRIVAELALKVMVDLAESEKEKMKLETSYIHSLEVSLITRMRQRLGGDTVRQLVQTKFSHYRATLGERSLHTVTMFIDIAELHLEDARKLDAQEKRHEKEASERKAEKILLKVVRQGEKFPDDLYRVGGYFMAAQYLGRLYFAKQDFQNAYKYYSRAALWGTKKLGRFHSFTCLILNEVRALQKLVELGLIDIKLEEDDQQSHNTKGDQEQDSQGADLEVAPSTGITNDLELAPPTGQEFSSEVVGNALPAGMNESCEKACHRDTLPTEFAIGLQDSSSNLIAQNSEYPFVQEAADSYAWDFVASAPDVSQDRAVEVMFDGPSASATQDLPMFFGEDLTGFDLHMYCIDQPVDCTGDAHTLIYGDEHVPRDSCI